MVRPETQIFQSHLLDRDVLLSIEVRVNREFGVVGGVEMVQETENRKGDEDKQVVSLSEACDNAAKLVALFETVNSGVATI